MREDRGRLHRDNSQDSLCSHTAVVINLLDKHAETKMEAFQTCTGDRPDIFVGSGFFFTCMKVLYLIGCTISVKRGAHLIVALVLAGQSDASSQRNLGIFYIFF